jgi:hypothetical protein
MKIRPKNWGSFQHYRNRNPPWIKLHKQLLDNYEYQCLPIASKALAPMLWLLASEDAAGIIDAAEPKLAFRLRLTATEVAEALKPLLDTGFFEVVQDASGALARRSQLAMPEREAETEVEAEQLSAVADVCSFDKFWEGYPGSPEQRRNMSRKAAQSQWDRLTPEKRTAALAALDGFRAHCAGNSWYRPLHAERFLSQERFEGYAAAGNVQPILDTDALRAAWDGEAGKLIDALGEKGAEKFSSWFKGAQFEPGPPVRICLAKIAHRNYVMANMAKPLRAAFGEVVLEVAA